MRLLVSAAIAGFVTVTLWASPAAASSVTTVRSNIPDHFWVDQADYGAQVPPAIAVAEQATITAPLEAPTATTTYAWIMDALGAQDWTQVGIAWFAGQQPFVFADSDQAFEIGPTIAPGASVTVRLAKQGGQWVDEYLAGASGWQVLQRSVVAGELTPPTVEGYFNGSASPGQWLFRGVGYEAPAGYYTGPLVWHHMAAVGIGNGQPDA